jgi:hypothetical protein
MGVPDSAAGVATDAIMGTAEFAEETVLEPWEAIFTRAGISGAQFGNEARVGIERMLGYDSKIENRPDAEDLFRNLVGDDLVEKAMDDTELMKNIAWAGLDVAGASLFKTLGRAAPKITKAMQGVMVGGITYGTAQSVIDKANKGELSAKDTAEVLIAGLGSLAMTKVAVGYVARLATPQLRKAVGRQVGKAGVKLAEEAGYLGNPRARDADLIAASRRLGVERIRLEEEVATLQARMDDAENLGLSGDELGELDTLFETARTRLDQVKRSETKIALTAGAKKLREERGVERTATSGEEAFDPTANDQIQAPVKADGTVDENALPTDVRPTEGGPVADSVPPRQSREPVTGTEAQLYGSDRRPVNVTEMTDVEIAAHARQVGVEGRDIEPLVREMDTTVEMLRAAADGLPKDDPMRQEILTASRESTKQSGRTGWIHKTRRWLISPTRSIVRGYGEAGKKLMTLFDEGTIRGEQLTDEAIGKINEVIGSLGDDGLQKLGRALREDGQVHPEARVAYDVVKGVLNDMFEDAYEFGGREALDKAERLYREAFPDLHTTASLVDPTKRAALVDFLFNTGKARSRDDATAMIDAALLGSEGRMEVAIGNQLYQTQSGVNRANLDPSENLEAFIYQTYKDVTQSGTRAELNTALNKIFDEYGSEKSEYTRQAFSRMLGEDKRGVDEFGLPTAAAKISAALRKFAIVTMLNPLSTVANATQGPLNSLLVVDSKSWLKAAGKSIFASRHARKMVEATGAITQSVINDQLNQKVGSTGKGLASKWMTAIGFRSVEIHNNKFAATAGIYYVDGLLSKLERKPKSWRTRSRLKELGLDPDAITKEGITDATRELAKKFGGNQIARQTQFRADVADLPMFWTSPVGKVVFQFQSFAYHQARLVSRSLWNETIKRQNPRPLITVLGVMGITGKGISEIREAYTGKEYSHDTPLDEWLYYISLTGGVGLMNDFMTGQAEGSPSWLSQRLAGPMGNTIMEGYDAIQNDSGAPGNTKRERFLAKRVPGLGPAIDGRFVTDEGFGVVDTDEKNIYRRVASIERQRGREIDGVMEELWAGNYETAFIKAETFGYELTESKAENRRRNDVVARMAKAAGRVDDVPDEDWRKRAEMYRSFPEVAGHWEHVVEQNEFWQANVSQQTATGKNRKQWLLRMRTSWRADVAEPVLQNLIAQADDDTAHAWTQFAEYWRARNADLESRMLSPNSVYNKEKHDKYEKFITDWMAYDEGFAEQMTLLPTELFRR